MMFLMLQATMTIVVGLAVSVAVQRITKHFGLPLFLIFIVAADSDMTLIQMTLTKDLINLGIVSTELAASKAWIILWDLIPVNILLIAGINLITQASQLSKAKKVNS